MPIYFRMIQICYEFWIQFRCNDLRQRAKRQKIIYCSIIKGKLINKNRMFWKCGLISILNKPECDSQVSESPCLILALFFLFSFCLAIFACFIISCDLTPLIIVSILSTSSRRAKNLLRFWERSFWYLTIIPVGRCFSWTQVEFLFTSFSSVCLAAH